MSDVRCTYCGERVDERTLRWTGEDDGFACADCAEPLDPEVAAVMDDVEELSGIWAMPR